MPAKFEINLTSNEGTPFSLVISPESEDIEAIIYVSEQEASENGEAVNQLLEGNSYEYKLTNDYKFAEHSGIIKPSQLNPSSGRITPGNYVGTLSLDILDKSEQLLTKLLLEVRSIKTTYRKDYRYMLEYITNTCTDLLMQHTSPVTQTFTTDYLKNSETIYQRFAFVKSIIDSDEFNQAIHRILTNPVKGWEVIDEESDIRRLRKLNYHQVRQIVSKKDRIVVPVESNLRKSLKFNSLPRTIRTIKKNETVDIPENRFIKYVLENFFSFISEVRYLIEALDSHPKTYHEALFLEAKIGSILKHSIFKEISPPATLPLNSPVLQRKEGYREILRVWLIFDLAARLIWKGGDDVYKAGKRDVAVLYEYWLFFRLLDILKEIYSIEPSNPKDLIEETSDGLCLKLKSGEYLPLKGVFNKDGRSLNVEFSYNRTFSGEKEYPGEGSWARSLRPDYTLTIWPSGFSSKEAEKQELIVHIHFDSKYKIENLTEIIGKDEEDLNEEKKEQRLGTYKRADLLKMHAYKDAIRRTGGAYILYPGDISKQLKGFHEIIPGLGAFCVRPNRTDDGTSELKSFIIEVTQHLLNRASQHDRLTYHTFDILKGKSDDKIFDRIPEIYEGRRIAHPAETFVLIGYCKNEEHLKWINRTGLYNFRMNTVRGSLRLEPETAAASYILLHPEGGLISGDIRRILKKGPRILSKENLSNLGYPSPGNDYYLVYEIEKTIENTFNNLRWDISSLDKFQSGRTSGIPIAVSLLELMKVKVY
jgi:predicted component of viral defense system (DUF524 family)